MFDRLFDLLLTLLDDLKCWIIIPVFNKALLLRGGKSHGVLEPGFHWKIPFWDQPQEHTVVTTTLSSQVQSLITKDGRQLAVKAIVKYNIEDITAFVEEIYDAFDAIQDITQAKIMLIINARTYEECRDTEDISNEVTKKVRAEVKKYGIYLQQVTLTDLVETPSYRIFSDGGLCAN